MGLGDWLGRQLQDTTYGDGWQARQQAAAADQALRYVAQQRAWAQQQAQEEQQARAQKRLEAQQYFDDALKLATGAGRYDDEGNFVSPKIPAPPAGFAYDPADLQALVESTARTAADTRGLAAEKTRSDLAKARAQIALDNARAKAASEPDPLKRQKLLADIARANASTDWTNAQLGGWVPPGVALGAASRGAGLTGASPEEVAGWLGAFFGKLAPGGGAPGRNPFAAPGHGGEPAPPTKPEPAPFRGPVQGAPMPESVARQGGTVIYGGRVLPWAQVPPYVQAKIIQRETGGR